MPRWRRPQAGEDSHPAAAPPGGGLLPHDSGERGLISFDHALDSGFNISLLAGDTRSDAYWGNAAISRAYCAIKCHGETHDPEDYVYDGSDD